MRLQFFHVYLLLTVSALSDVFDAVVVMQSEVLLVYFFCAKSNNCLVITSYRKSGLDFQSL